MTDADVPGVEKVVCTPMKPAWRTSPPVGYADLQIPGNYVPPESFFMVKGWNRSVSCMAVLWACFETEGMLEAHLGFLVAIQSLSTLNSD